MTGQAITAAGAWNEAYKQDGTVREHWQYLLGSLRAFGTEAFSARQQMVDRLLRDDGATYNDYGQGLAGRDWKLDPIPLLIDSREWAHIEAGVRERAELLNLVLRDLYGQRELIRLGVIPAELVFGHRDFLRPCHGITLPGEQQLIQYAADMVRGADGAMRIISDRTQIPSGTGYTLENRMVMSRVFPSLFRDSHVHRLSLYFNSLRLKLNALGPNGGVARVVMLTPGAYNETYFEHVFLANHLGYSLVQGSDLTVRDGYVWMKTLDGLSRIDVILRRVDDYYCDPVELKGDSQLGVPGLLEVIRNGRVVVSNPLGSGILENGALLKYLPAAARHFLGRDLMLEAAPTYWCGDPEDLAHTLDRLPELVIKTTARGASYRTTYGGELAAGQLAALGEAIRARPMQFIAQEYLQPSVAPVWEGDAGQSRPSVLRSFAVAGESSYIVMPGGLTRVGQPGAGVEISNRAGSLSKDTWVLASEPEKPESPAAGAAVTEAGRIWLGMELPSRVVENLFWLGRYTERAESALRLLRTVFNRLSGANTPDPGSRLMLLRAVTQLTCTYPGFMDESANSAEPQEGLLSVVLDRNRPGSVAASISALLNAVDEVRDFMSADTQRILNDLRDNMAQLPDRLRLSYSVVPEEELDALVTTLLALAGLTHESMMRGQGWHFLEMGRRMERTLQILSLLRSLWVQVVPAREESVLLETALLSVDSLITYRRRYQQHMDIGNGLDLLLLEPGNPRSVMYQLNALQGHLEQLPDSGESGKLSAQGRMLLEASTNLRLADMQQLATAGDGQYLRSELDQLLSRTHYLVAQAATALGDQYFDHTGGPRPLAQGEWEVQP